MQSACIQKDSLLLLLLKLLVLRRLGFALFPRAIISDQTLVHRGFRKFVT